MNVTDFSQKAYFKGSSTKFDRKSIVIGGYGDAPAYRHTRPPLQN